MLKPSKKISPTSPPEPDKQAEWQSSTFKAPGIQEKLATAQAAFADSDRIYAETVLEAELDENPDNAAGHAKKVAAHLAKREADRLRIEELNVALAGALKRDEDERGRILADMHKTTIKVCTSHLRARDAAAEALSTSLAEVIRQFRIMTERSAKAKSAMPDFGLERGRKIEPDELFKLVEKEIARLYAIHGAPTPISGKCGFPGGNTHDITHLHQPQLLKPLADGLKESSNAVLAVLTGKVAG